MFLETPAPARDQAHALPVPDSVTRKNKRCEASTSAVEGSPPLASRVFDPDSDLPGPRRSSVLGLVQGRFRASTCVSGAGRCGGLLDVLTG